MYGNLLICFVYSVSLFHQYNFFPSHLKIKTNKPQQNNQMVEILDNKKKELFYSKLI